MAILGRMRRWGSAFGVAALLATCSTAEAQTEEPAGTPGRAPVAGEVTAPARPHPRRIVSMTISPFHLLVHMVELTGELRANDKIGVAVIAGFGQLSDTLEDTDISTTVYEAGTQLRYYVVGDFRHGMQLGAELLYLKLTDHRISTEGEGVAIGPFAGYKFTTDVGFTVDCQLGVEYIAARAQSNAGVTGRANGSTYIPLVNVNIGWSF
jgi:hypothetical protein